MMQARLHTQHLTWDFIFGHCPSTTSTMSRNQLIATHQSTDLGNKFC